jgi:polyhydroxyalkanoate synthesis regulator phasin
MDQRQELLSLLCGLRDHSGTENQALREVALSRVNQIQVEKESLRKQIDELEPVPEGELSYHTTDVEVKQVVAQIMQMDRESNEHLLREMDALKAEADSQSQARTNIRRVRDAYTKRLSPVNWEAYS